MWSYVIRFANWLLELAGVRDGTEKATELLDPQEAVNSLRADIMAAEPDIKGVA
jgi:hypothetical protein